MYSKQNGEVPKRARSPVQKIRRNRLDRFESNNSETHGTTNSSMSEIKTWKKRKKEQTDNGNNFYEDCDAYNQTCGDNDSTISGETTSSFTESPEVFSLNNSFFHTTPSVSDNTNATNPKLINCEHIFNEYTRSLELLTEVNTYFKTEKQSKLTSYVIEVYNGSFFWDQISGDYLENEEQAKEQAYAVGCKRLITRFGHELAFQFGAELLRHRNQQQQEYWNPWNVFQVIPMPSLQSIPKNPPLPPMPPPQQSNPPLPPIPPPQQMSLLSQNNPPLPPMPQPQQIFNQINPPLPPLPPPVPKIPSTVGSNLGAPDVRFPGQNYLTPPPLPRQPFGGRSHTMPTPNHCITAHPVLYKLAREQI